MAYFSKSFGQARRFPFEEDVSRLKCRLSAAPAHKDPSCQKNPCPLNGIGSSSAPLILFRFAVCRGTKRFEGISQALGQ
ncbi:hypothetical protein CEXT_341721 [Caerostris extrusa]|uniref:Uncharacterized protein n=1 Tax=Caerostris extrusa TaxID=172846 RepID=A0AAV4QSN1_CAEEX|nr:hypothetical protein CEXT_341721 [Caerostris extrusa]